MVEKYLPSTMYPPLASRDTHDQFSIKTLLSNKNRAKARALGDAEYAPDPKGHVMRPTQKAMSGE